MYHHRMGRGGWGYWRPGFFMRPRFFWRRRFFPCCGCGFLLPVLMVAGACVLFLAHVI